MASCGLSRGGRDPRGSGEATETAPRTAGSRKRPSTPAARCGGRSAGSGGRSPCRCGTWRARWNGRAQSAARSRGLPRAGSDATSPERDMGKGECGRCELCMASGVELKVGETLRAPARGRSETPRRRLLWARGHAAPAAATLAPRLAHHLEDVFGGAAADARGECDLALLLHPGAHGAPYGPPDRFGQREVRLRVTDHRGCSRSISLVVAPSAARATGPETSRAHRLAPPPPPPHTAAPAGSATAARAERAPRRRPPPPSPPSECPT